jgi:hypothetical protein
MIQDTIERFRYRFELWRLQRREGSFWRSDPRPADLGEPALWEDPKYEMLWTESTPRFIIREATLYVGILLLISNVAFLIARFFPSARHAVGVTFLWVIGLWTFLSTLMTIDTLKKRKAYRIKCAKSSNQAMQLTAGRPEPNVTVHESAFRPATPRPRQR